MRLITASYIALLALLSSPLLVSATDGSERDHTGCPKVFMEKCSCGRTNYKFWHADEKVYVVNCTNAGLKSEWFTYIFFLSLIQIRKLGRVHRSNREAVPEQPFFEYATVLLNKKILLSAKAVSAIAGMTALKLIVTAEYEKRVQFAFPVRF